MPEGMTMPEGMEIPSDFGGMDTTGETKELDVANAHISVQIDDGKEGGSLEDLTPGCFVTVTINGKGEVTNVLITSRSFFRGSRTSG